MFEIGICDDKKQECQNVYNLCEEYFKEREVEHKYIFFSSGEEVLSYCEKIENERIDLLFLDVEMDGISGIELKDALMKQDKIWRISFVTSHLDSVYGAFSQKTIGFIPKPPNLESISKAIRIVQDELEEDYMVIFNGYNGEKISIRLEEIAYFKANESYTEIVTCPTDNHGSESSVVAKKIGDIEKELKNTSVVRVHKSYLVNLANVSDIGKNVIMRESMGEIPLGRVFKKNAQKRFLDYRKDKIRKRL